MTNTLLRRRRHAAFAFTLVELLTVIGIIAVLAAIIFPVFATARGKARQAACSSNLRQIGMATQMYAQDYDGQFPWAIDASDYAIPAMWPAACRPFLDSLPLIHRLEGGSRGPGALDPYIKAPELWRCPGDTGFDRLDNNFDPMTGDLRPMPARPTMYEKYGGSYLFRTEIAFKQKSIDVLTGWTREGGQWREVGQGKINVLFDGNGSWHGSGFLFAQKRYNVLFADNHVKSLSFDQEQEAWDTALDPEVGPSSRPCP